MDQHAHTGRQGIALKHRISLQKSLCLVVMCPYYVALRVECALVQINSSQSSSSEHH